MSTAELQGALNLHGSISAFIKHTNGGRSNPHARSLINARIKAEQIIWKKGRKVGPTARIYNNIQLTEAFQLAICWNDVYKYLGVSASGHNKQSIISFADHYGMVIPSFTKTQLTEAYRRGKEKRWDPSDIFVIDSKFSRPNLRNAVLKYHILPTYQCDQCHQGNVWNGATLTLELDHINGIHTDNRPTNLRWMCPNCHSQTSTFKGKNR